MSKTLNHFRVLALLALIYYTLSLCKPNMKHEIYGQKKTKKNYKGNTTKVTFARMSLHVHATNCISYLIRVNGNPNKGCSCC